jgi:chitinase
VFTLADAAAVTAFAGALGLGRVSIWSAARAGACARPGGGAEDGCSGVTQTPDAFSQTLGHW